MALAPQNSRFYARQGNPNNEQVEAVLAQLEGAEHALLTSSGMAAFSTMVLAFCESGDHVVAQDVQYGGTIGFLEKARRFGIETTFVPQDDPQAFAQAVRPNTKLIFTETPSNPSMKLTDLAAVAAIGQRHGILTRPRARPDHTSGSPARIRRGAG